MYKFTLESEERVRFLYMSAYFAYVAILNFTILLILLIQNSNE